MLSIRFCFLFFIFFVLCYSFIRCYLWFYIKHSKCNYLEKKLFASKSACFHFIQIFIIIFFFYIFSFYIAFIHKMKKLPEFCCFLFHLVFIRFYLTLMLCSIEKMNTKKLNIFKYMKLVYILTVLLTLTLSVMWQWIVIARAKIN